MPTQSDESQKNDEPQIVSESFSCRRADFPIFTSTEDERPLIYLDSGATTHKPHQVIETLREYYERDNANIHRAVYALGERATMRYEEARGKVARFLNTRSDAEVIFVRGTTEAINLVASSLTSRIQSGDEILVTHLEHHANIVPWQLLCQRTGAQLKVLPIDDHGDLCLDQLESLVNERTRIMALPHISNALGTVNPVQQLCDFARARGILTLIDGAQAIAHTPVDMQTLGCDFYAFSGHKLYGPTGIGVLYGREELLNQMPPYQGGGDMIEEVYFEGSTYKPVPSRFEAGTPNIAGAVGLGAAVDYVNSLDLNLVHRYESDLIEYGAALLASEIPGIRLIGTPKQRASAISFVIEGTHPHDVGTLLDGYGIAVRVGHHCAQPIMRHFGVSSTTRASIGVYNQRSDFDHLVASLHRVIKMLCS
jgi:cysteine desulfurase/selenocysteine lyase